MRDFVLEKWLKEQGIENFRYVTDLPMARIDPSPRSQAQVRPLNLNEELIEDYTSAKTNGADFPAIVVEEIEGKEKLDILNGFHRFHAFQRASVSTIDAYVVHPASPMISQLIARSINLLNGLRPSKEEQLMQALYLVEQGQTVEAAAQQLQLKQSVIKQEVAKSTIRRILEQQGVKIDLPAKYTNLLFRFRNNPEILKETAIALNDAKLSEVLAKEFIKEVDSSPTPLDTISEWREGRLVESIALAGYGRIKPQQLPHAILASRILQITTLCQKTRNGPLPTLTDKILLHDRIIKAIEELHLTLTFLEDKHAAIPRNHSADTLAAQ